ncbi:MAG TPA: ankyrin repeat domain-containing protein, partial [Candidatus Babeliaceae bacterium]|nr:ankyrin repeat domain-containing protein [Candidatus Babeliaceae bacterium]
DVYCKRRNLKDDKLSDNLFDEIFRLLVLYGGRADLGKADQRKIFDGLFTHPLLRDTLKQEKAEVEALVADDIGPMVLDKKNLSVLAYAALRNSSAIFNILVNYKGYRHDGEALYQTLDILYTLSKSKYIAQERWNLIKQNLDCAVTLAVRDNYTEPSSIALFHKPVGDTALFYAARAGNRSVVELLLEKGVNVLERNENEESAWSCAHANGHIQVAQIIAEAAATQLLTKATETAKPEDLAVESYFSWLPFELLVNIMAYVLAQDIRHCT